MQPSRRHGARRRALFVGLLAVCSTLAASVPAGAFAPGDRVQVTATGDVGEVVYTAATTPRDVVLLDGATALKAYPRAELQAEPVDADGDGFSDDVDSCPAQPGVAPDGCPVPVGSYTYSPASPVTGEPVSFDATGSTCPAGPCTYSWDDVNGGVWPLGTGQTFQFAFQSPGDKHVRLTVVDARGRVSTETQIVAVAPPPPDELRLSYETDHDPSVDLDGATITGPACVFLNNSPAKTGPVTFYLDGVQGRTESSPPWDFFGGSATVCTLGAFASGAHEIKATWSGGQDTSTFTVGTAPPPPPPPNDAAPSWDPTGSYTKTFSDEFNDTEIDPTKWQRGWFGEGVTRWVNNLEDDCFDSANVSESGGYARLRLTASPAVCGGATQPYRGALIWANPPSGRIAQQYGSWEAEVCGPDDNSDGQVDNWPGFWTAGVEPPAWPASGELDIAEGGGGEYNYHAHDAPTGTHRQFNWSAPQSYAGCHRHGIEWQPDGTVRVFRDGVQVTSHPFAGNPQTVVFNHSVNDDSGHPVTAPSEMRVNWVRVFSPNPNPPTGTGIYPDGFPDASNTGPTGALTPSSGTLTVTTPGTVIANRDHSGAIAIQADNVTVRNSRVTSGASFPIRIFSGADNVTIEDVEVDCNGSATNDSAMVSNGDFDTYRRNDIHECGDGIDPGDFTLIEDNFIHDFNFTGVDPHYDGIQCTGGENGITIRHNTLDNQQDQTSAIICKSDFGPIDDILIENNFLNGGAFTVYSRDGASGGTTYPAPTNDRLINNWFGGSVSVFATGTRWGASFGNCTTNGSAWTAKSGNRYWPSGEPVDKC